MLKDIMTIKDGFVTLKVLLIQPFSFIIITISQAKRIGIKNREGMMLENLTLFSSLFFYTKMIKSCLSKNKRGEI